MAAMHTSTLHKIAIAVTSLFAVSSLAACSPAKKTATTGGKKPTIAKTVKPSAKKPVAKKVNKKR